MATVQELESLKKRRDSLASQKAALVGRKDHLESEQKRLRSEITEAGYDPDTIQDVLKEKKEALQGSLESFEADLTIAEESLKKFTEETDEG